MRNYLESKCSTLNKRRIRTSSVFATRIEEHCLVPESLQLITGSVELRFECGLIIFVPFSQGVFPVLGSVSVHVCKSRH